MSRYWETMVLATLLCAGSLTQAAEASFAPLKSVADIALAGRASRFDYQAYDATRHLLFVAHLGDDAVTVVDTDARRVVANIPGLKQVHGLVVIPALGRVYASATGAREVVAIDESDFRVVATMRGGDYPDGLSYAPPFHKLYVSDERGGAVVVIDVARNRTVGAIPLGGEAGNIRYDPVSRHLFVNVQTHSELVEIDPETDRVVGRHPLPGAAGNHGLLIEPELRRAFIADEGNARLLVVDLRTLAVLSSLPVGTEPDVLDFDPGLGWLYVASESGVLSIFKVAEGEVRKLGDMRIAPRAHSVAVAPDTHRLYLPIENVDGRPVMRVMEPAH